MSKQDRRTGPNKPRDEAHPDGTCQRCGTTTEYLAVVVAENALQEYCPACARTLGGHHAAWADQAEQEAKGRAKLKNAEEK